MNRGPSNTSAGQWSLSLATTALVALGAYATWRGAAVLLFELGPRPIFVAAGAYSLLPSVMLLGGQLLLARSTGGQYALSVVALLVAGSSVLGYHDPPSSLGPLRLLGFNLRGTSFASIDLPGTLFAASGQVALVAFTLAIALWLHGGNAGRSPRMSDAMNA